jgi:hypothetical protein
VGSLVCVARIPTNQDYLPVYCGRVSWSPAKTILSWAIVVPVPRALMYLAGPRASSSGSSSTGPRMEDYHGHMQTAGRQSVVDVQDEDIALRIFYGYLGRFTDTECILFSFFWVFVSYPIR